MKYRYLVIHILTILLFFVFPNQSSAQLNVTLEVENPLCGGFPTGQITATPSGGTSPYFYRWNTGAVSSFIENLESNIYTVTVTDNGGQQIVKSANVVEPPELISNIQRSSCEGDSNLKAVVTGGAPPYLYQWSTGETTPVIINPTPREYCLTITDARTCIDIRCITYTTTPLSVTVTNGAVANCGDSATGSAQAVISGGSSPYTYYWNTGATSQSLNEIPPGVYAVTLTDATGCIANDSGLITPLAGEGFSLNLTLNQPNCQNNNDGSLTAEVSGGIAPFTYQWSNGASTATINNLAVGDYTVTVTAANGCQQIESLAIDAGSNLSVNVTTINESCAGGSDGSITAIATNGQSPYQYQWSTGATTPTITNLTAGSYRVTVTDARGCAVTRISSVLPATAFRANISSNSPAACGNQNTGSLTAMPTGGTSPYAIMWSTGATTATIDSLMAGTYELTVTDVRGCMAFTSATIESVSVMTVDIETTGFVCANDSNGVATAVVTGGTAPFTYLWSNDATTVSNDSFPAGIFGVTVTDSNGCSATDNDVFVNAASFEILTEINQPSCNGDTNGGIVVRIPNGAAPFQINSFDIVTGTGASAGQVIENEPFAVNDLPAATYKITVTDAAGCMQIDTATIMEPAFFSVTTATTPTSCLEENGTATAFPNGGTAPYTFEWEDGQTGMTAFNLSSLMYLVSVTDANGCQVVANATVNEPMELAINIDATEELCAGINIGNATATVNNGTAPFTYQWDTGATTNSINNLSAGTYCVTITDAVGCSNVRCAIIGLAMPPIVTIQGDNVVCAGENTARLFAVVSNSEEDNLLFRWNTGASEPSIVNVGAGMYRVTVSEASGCSSTATFNVLSTPDLAIEVTDIQDVSCDSLADGTAIATGIGGLPPYQYLWSDGQTEATGSNFSEGDYSVTVADANGCTASTGVTIGLAASSIVIDASVRATNCGGAESGSIIVLATGGLFPYTFSFSTGFSETETIPNSGSQITDLAVGEYQLTVTDANGCTAFADYSVNSAAAIELIIFADDETCAGTMDGRIEVNASGGVPPYRYEWSNGATTATQTNLAAGSYSVTVIDDNFCNERATVSVNSAGGLQLTLTSSPTCQNENTGTATVTPNQGEAPFSYLWSDGQTTTTAQYLPAGNIIVTVTDARACMEVGNIEIETNLDCLSDHEDELVRLYPNPVLDEIHVEIIENLGQQVEVELLSMNGEQLQFYALPTDATDVLLPVRSLPKGIYMVKINYVNEGERLMKVIKY
ncbi:MAG: T9SS type A sorting domain-containing protein [Saprospiraceae bacterium]